MAVTNKLMFRGAATTTVTTTLYTVPSATTAVVTEIVAVNTANTSATFTISLNGVVAVPAVTVGANDSTVVPLKQVLNANQILAGGASATTVNLHISGVEIA